MTDTSEHPACLSDDLLCQCCRFQRTRRGGPGGQHRNKVETAIVVRHLPSGILGQAGERRSQHANRTAALQRLRVNLAVGIRSSEISPKPSARWQSRCESGRMRISVSHADFPCLLAEALDQIHASDYQMRQAAEKLMVSTSQLIRFLKRVETAFKWVNAQRQTRGLMPLK